MNPGRADRSLDGRTHFKTVRTLAARYILGWMLLVSLLCPAWAQDKFLKERPLLRAPYREQLASYLAQIIQWDKDSIRELQFTARTDVHIQLLLGIAYEHGTSVQRDDRAAAEWYTKALRSGDEMAAFQMLALAASHRVPDETDLNPLLIYFVRIATSRNGEARNNLGTLYLLGRIGKNDCATAALWFRKAADLGLPQGQFNLGNMYIHGRGVPQSQLEARQWYARAAMQGFAPAENEMGVTSADPTEAMKWYQMAAAQGYAPAMNNIGVLYAQGRGTVQDLVQAAAWYRNAAELGLASAQNNLGTMAATGKGMDLNDVEAFEWFERSAEQHHGPAALNLGTMYATGRGTPANPTMAYAWLRIALAMDQPVARELIEGVKKQLKAEDMLRSDGIMDEVLSDNDR